MNLVPTSTRIIAAAAVVVTGAAVLTGGRVAQAQPARDPAGTGPQLQTIELQPAAGASPTGKSFASPGAVRAESAGGAMAVSQRGTRPFSLVGATWTDPRATLDGTVEVRTRAVDGRWTGWQPLESDGPDAADPGTEHGPVRGSTDPLWVDESNGVEARVAAADGRTRPLPAGLRLDLINPDVRAEAAPQAQAAAYPARPVPRLVTRSGWRANEAIVQHPPEYTTDVQVMFVHHTATSNTYSCGQSAGIVRGIELYQVKSRGWNDIGYNFLVDKCGTLFEGRKGGVDKPVLGAHTLGFNAHSSAIAVIGNYTASGVPATVRNVIAQVAAYKVGADGNNPSGTVVLTSNGSDRYPTGTRVRLNRISGHRDTGRTECPGDALFAQLGTIRRIAGAGPTGLGFPRVTGATKAGSRYFTRGLIRPLWSLSTPSALLDRFDVFLDGTLVASTPNTHRTTALRIGAGSHTVAVRAVHLSGRTASVTARVVSDAAAPVFGAGPEVALRPGSLKAAVPMRLAWTVTDAGGLRAVALTRPSVVNLGAAPRTWPGFAAPGVANTWTLRATDWAGNATAASVIRTPVVMSEAAAARTGSWRTLRDPAYLGGRAMISVGAGASMTYTIGGRGAQLAVSRTHGSGRLRAYVDGQYAGMLDLRSATTVHRMAVWALNWRAGGIHTLKVVLEGTTGRPGVIMDGMVVLR